MELVEKCSIKDFPLVCTYGQVKLAGMILLDSLVKSGFKLYYSGDIDPEGLQIADKLKCRYKENLEFVGFDVNTYLKNMSNLKLSDSRLSKLKQITSSELKKVCDVLEDDKKAAYEEENIDRLNEFINKCILSKSGHII